MTTGNIYRQGKKVSMLPPMPDGAVQIGKPQDAEGGDNDDLAESGEVNSQPGCAAAEYGGFYQVNETHRSIMLVVAHISTRASAHSAADLNTVFRGP